MRDRARGGGVLRNSTVSARADVGNPPIHLPLLVALPVRTSGISRLACAVADAHDNDLLPANPITDDVGRYGNQLPQICSGHRPPTEGKVLQTIPGPEQGIGHVMGRLRIEIEKVIVSPPNTLQSGPGPDNRHGSEFRRRYSFALCQLCEPLANTFMRDHAPSRIISLSLGIKVAFMCRIRLHIEDRFEFWFSHEHLPTISLHSRN